LREIAPPRQLNRSTSCLAMENNQDQSALRNVDGLRHEYSEVNNDIRNHTNLRFTIFTVYLLALGGLLSIAFGLVETKSANPDQLKRIGRIGGLLVTLLFFFYEVRLQSLINHHFDIAKQLERTLGYTHISTRHSWRWYRTHHITIVFFLIMIAFWVKMVFS
jgi:hypothetical protein